MPTQIATMKRLKAAAAQAAARAAAAKDKVRSAKAELKQARKLLKAEKKAAKQARRKVEAAAAAAAPVRPKPAALVQPSVRKRAPAKSVRSAPRRTPKPRAAPKLRAAKSPATMRTAAQVAKTVIERLHRPPPLAPAPIIAADTVPPASADPPEA
jgi:hypothetical protein